MGFTSRRKRLCEIEEAEAALKRRTDETEVHFREQRYEATEIAQEARQMQASVKFKLVTWDVRMLDQMQSLPLKGRIRVAVWIGRYPREDDDAYQARRERLVARRAWQWRQRHDYEHSLLDLAEEQNGLCGNPTKDSYDKGCGCCLYALPAGTVHFDHIEPQSKGGGDETENIQALCHSCNLSAGNRTAPTRSSANEMPRWAQGLMHWSFRKRALDAEYARRLDRLSSSDSAAIADLDEWKAQEIE